MKCIAKSSKCVWFSIFFVLQQQLKREYSDTKYRSAMMNKNMHSRVRETNNYSSIKISVMFINS